MSLALVLVVAAAALLGLLLGALLAQLRAARRVEQLRLELVEARVRLESAAVQDSDRL